MRFVREHVVPLLVGHARDEAVAGDAGVVHEDLDRPERRPRPRVNAASTAVGVGDVGLDGERRRRPSASTAACVSFAPSASHE